MATPLGVIALWDLAWKALASAVPVLRVPAPMAMASGGPAPLRSALLAAARKAPAYAARAFKALVWRDFALELKSASKEPAITTLGCGVTAITTLPCVVAVTRVSV